MKHILTLLSAILLTLLSSNVYAQKNKSEDDYKLKKAIELLQNGGDETQALDLLDKQLEATPDNVQALVQRARLYRRSRELGPALADINHALRVNRPKKSTIPTSTLYWWKAWIYYDLRDYDKEVEAFRQAYELAQKDNKESLQQISFDYGSSLYRANDLDGADAMYRGMLREDESDTGALAGLARNWIWRKEPRQAIELLEKCIRLDADYSSPYFFLAQAYDQLGETVKAIDAALEWFEKDDNPDGDRIIGMLAKKYNYAEASVRSWVKKGKDPNHWRYFLCQFYEYFHRYAEAVRAYNELEAEFGYYPQFNVRRSDCYRELGLYKLAIADISKVMEEDADWYMYCQRGDYYRLSGDLDGAIRDFTAAMEEDPKDGYAHYKRGWCYEMKGDRAKAMADYYLGIDLDESYPYLYLMRGELRLACGDKTGAEADFEKLLQLDTVAVNNSCREYALHFLGRDEEAEAWMNRIIEADPEDDGNYYDQACLYAWMGRTQESVAALKTAFEKGYRDFNHIALDDDLDPVRDLPEFKALVEQYRTLHEEYLKEFDLEVPEPAGHVTEIAVKRHPGGTFEIPCDINGLPLQMIFDTGASDVTISSVEANFMLKNGYMSEKDIKGKRYYQVATGQISAGTVITLREIRLGDAVLKNVDASVVNSQQAPLLLGQSAMERLGSITIDNQSNKLIIKH